MYVISTTSLKSAERNGGGRPYLARLVAGPRGTVQREFIKPNKVSDNRRMLTTRAVSGDVFECRRWRWNQLRQQYEGGTIWFAVAAGGRICMLTRDEAFAAVGAVAVSTGGRPSVPDHRYPERMVPDDLMIADLSPEQLETRSTPIALTDER